jgi:hypothetical protein
MSIPKFKGMDQNIEQLLRVLKLLAFQSKGSQLFPPGFNQIKPTGVLGNKLDLDFRPGQQSSFHISAFIYYQIIFDNQPPSRWKLLIDTDHSTLLNGLSIGGDYNPLFSTNSGPCFCASWNQLCCLIQIRPSVLSHFRIILSDKCSPSLFSFSNGACLSYFQAQSLLLFIFVIQAQFLPFLCVLLSYFQMANAQILKRDSPLQVTAESLYYSRIPEMGSFSRKIYKFLPHLMIFQYLNRGILGAIALAESLKWSREDMMRVNSFSTLKAIERRVADRPIGCYPMGIFSTPPWLSRLPTLPGRYR